MDSISQLRNVLYERFSTDELRTMCFDVGIPYEDSPSTTLRGRSIWIVEYLSRRNRLRELVSYINETRDDIHVDQESFAVDALEVEKEPLFDLDSRDDLSEARAIVDALKSDKRIPDTLANALAYIIERA